MSKKYFAEYIPVEGEIKEGDKIIGKAGVILTAHTIPSNINEGDRKVELSLCSRDIQIGDKVIGSHKIEGVYFGKSQSGDFIINWEDGNTVCGLHDPDAFKVIGKISPEAKWVTRGMEFDEDELERWDRANEHMPYRRLKPEYYFDFRIGTDYIWKIKNPISK